MSLQVSSQSLANLTVGQSITPISWASLAPVFSGAHTLGAGYLRLFNESGCGLAVQFNGGSGAKYLPAGAWSTFTLHDDDTGLTGSVSYVLSNAAVNQLVATYYLPGELLDDTGPLGNSPLNGGTVNTSTAYQLFEADNVHYFIVRDGYFNPYAYVDLVPNLTPAGAIGTSLGYYNGGYSHGILIDPSGLYGGLQFVAPIRSVGGALGFGGIATAAGTLGVPVQVAAPIRQHITATTLTTVLTYTPANTGVFRLSPYVSVNNGISGNAILFRLSYDDPDTGVHNLNLTGINGSTTHFFDGVTNAANGPYPCAVYPFTQLGGQPITVTYQDPTNLPSDFITVMLEQLA